MAVSIRESITIDARIQQVWDYVLEHDEWRRPYITNVEKLDEGPHGVGSRYEDTFEMLGRAQTLVYEVIAFDPPNRWAWTQPGEPGPVYCVEGSYELEPVGEERTRFTLSGTYRGKGPVRLAEPLFGWFTGRTFRKLLDQLKTQVEAA